MVRNRTGKRTVSLKSDWTEKETAVGVMLTAVSWKRG